MRRKDYDSVFITLDKMDKIGLEGVAAELKENGYAEESVEKYLKLSKRLRAMWKASACVKKNYRAFCRLRRRMGWK